LEDYKSIFLNPGVPESHFNKQILSFYEHKLCSAAARDFAGIFIGHQKEAPRSGFLTALSQHIFLSIISLSRPKAPDLDYQPT